MAKMMKYVTGIMAIVTIAALNLSSQCAPKPVTAVPLTEVAYVRSEMPTPAEIFEAEEEGDVDFNLNPAEVGASELTWRTLADVEFKDVYIEELDAYYWKPTFGKSVTDLEGEEVYISGYIIPVDYDEDFYVLSRYPFANCFFCGGAGPESVIDLRLPAKTRKYETDERLTFKGKFALNADDVYQMNYILEGAVEYKP